MENQQKVINELAEHIKEFKFHKETLVQEIAEIDQKYTKKNEMPLETRRIYFERKQELRSVKRQIEHKSDFLMKYQARTKNG